MYSTHFLDYYIYKVENGQEVDSPAPKQIKKNMKWSIWSKNGSSITKNYKQQGIYQGCIKAEV